jgi:hypothetical protein
LNIEARMCGAITILYMAGNTIQIA